MILLFKVLSESEELSDKYVYHVQYAQVDKNDSLRHEKLLDTQEESHVYEAAYKGCNTCSIIKNLKPDSSYVFRVAAKVNDGGADNDLLFWSLPIYVSTLKTFHCTFKFL